ncbi:MAG: hypothetical protein HUJ51_00705 [Eggerthellaceae bacterium]|nr:hypothetical protein [Eggerthellaceae bacterium]
MLIVNTSSLEYYYHTIIGFFECDVFFTFKFFHYLIVNLLNFFCDVNKFYAEQIAKSCDLPRDNDQKYRKITVDAIHTQCYFGSSPSSYTTGLVWLGAAVKLCGKKDFYKSLEGAHEKKAKQPY